MKNKVNILGTQYKIIRKKYDEDLDFSEKGFAGYHNGLSKEIVICVVKTLPGTESTSDEDAAHSERETLKHEIVHAFFYQSGLDSSAMQYEGAWARCEEMVDWIAMQGEKIYKAWQEAGAL